MYCVVVRRTYCYKYISQLSRGVASLLSGEGAGLAAKVLAGPTDPDVLGHDLAALRQLPELGEHLIREGGVAGESSVRHVVLKGFARLAGRVSHANGAGGRLLVDGGMISTQLGWAQAGRRKDHGKSETDDKQARRRVCKEDDLTDKCSSMYEYAAGIHDI